MYPRPSFNSKDKFDSEPLAELPSRSRRRILLTRRITLFARRTEVHCPRCGHSLGMSLMTGDAAYKRYCINSVSLNFIEIKAQRII